MALCALPARIPVLSATFMAGFRGIPISAPGR